MGASYWDLVDTKCVSVKCGCVCRHGNLQLLVKNLQFEDGKMIPAAQYFRSADSAAVELNEEEKAFAEEMRVGCFFTVYTQQW